ncbi:hypothetical protein JS278_01557 [Acidipropionibacterium virtanenii]|uniref:Thioredoxin domain-containing protein n=1 Tax=Acidipropionibacterium virtanenii TaxID=2057246 RepID=A0A344UTX3_9ACTN|nr:hypothetical protein JS278_01557 [Acidipropionibacterium virtanenii]
MVTADEEHFNELIGKSMQHPVLLELTSAHANAQAMSDELERLTNEAAGRWLLVRVDVDATPQIAQALRVQAVPTLLPILAGQPVSQPIQGTLGADQLKDLTDQISELAVANGITGRAAPVATAPAPVEGQDGEQAPATDPRTAAVEKLLHQGRYADAVLGYDELLAKTPGDPVLLAGRAGAATLQRLDGQDPHALLEAGEAAAPGDVDAQLAAADVELMGGDPAKAFDRIIGAIRVTREEERERARTRLLELFEMVGSADPAVAPARRALAAALF